MKRRPAPKTTPVLSPYVVELDLDYPILHAQIVNCLQIAFASIRATFGESPGMLTFTKIEGMGATFSLDDKDGPYRIYQFKLLRPDGTQAHLGRYSTEGEGEAFEEPDKLFAEAISQTLRGTVSAAFKYLVKDPVRPTHQPSPILQ